MGKTEIQEYRRFKDTVINLLKEARETFISHFGEQDNVEVAAFEDLIIKTEEGRFSIIVVGEFSAGKSTFLNALMKEKYLDSFSSETTANINFLRSVNDSPTGKEMIRVNYSDGKQEVSYDVSFENIQKYVSTRGNNVAGNIDSVEIFLNSPFLNDGVDLIDSPGLNGVKELHADITKGQMKSSHAAIFMFRATQPGSRSDFQTLLELKKACKSIIVVLNRIDEAAKEGEETVEDIVNKLKNNFKKEFPNEKIPEIWPISAYKALVARSSLKLDYNERTDHTIEEKKKFLETSRIEEFENRLLRYITKGERTKNELLSPVEKIISSTNDAINSLNTEKKALEGKFSSNEIDNQIEIITNEIKELKSTISTKKDDVGNAILDAIRNTKNSIKSDTKDLKEETIRNLECETSLIDLEDNAKNYVARIQSKYQSIYSDALIELESEFRSAIRRNIDGSVIAINKHLKDICSTSENISLGGIELDSSHFNVDIDFSKYDSKIEKLKKERIEALEKQYDAEDKALEKEAIKKEIEKIKRDLAIENEIYKNNSVSLSDPGVNYRTEYTEREFRTGSKRSWINPKRWFNGAYEIRIERIEEKVADYTEHNHYLEEKERLTNVYNEKIRQLNENISKLEENLLSAQNNKSQARRYKIMKEELDQQIREQREEKDRLLSQAIHKQIVKAKTYIKDVFNDLEKNSRTIILNIISNKEEELIMLAEMVLEGEIKEELQLKTKKLESLKKELELAENEKEERLQKIGEAISALQNLNEKADALRNNIEQIETDIIDEQ